MGSQVGGRNGRQMDKYVWRIYWVYVVGRKKQWVKKCEEKAMGGRKHSM